MGFLFEILAPMFGGMISQLYQDGKLKMKKATFLVWLSSFLCFIGMGIFSSSPFDMKDLAITFLFSIFATAICAIIFIISNQFQSKKK